MKFTFRKEAPETGLRAVGNTRPSTQIKLRGKEIGRISAPNRQTKDDKWGVGLMVDDPAGENCPWRWVFFKARHDSEPEARAWLLANSPHLFDKYSFESRLADGA